MYNPLSTLAAYFYDRLAPAAPPGPPLPQSPSPPPQSPSFRKPAAYKNINATSLTQPQT